MKVYSPEHNYKLDKITMAAKLFNKTLTHEKVDFDAKVSKGFKEAYPHFSLPVLETPNGKFLTGTNSILLYLSAGAQVSFFTCLG
ncbi:MAG: hypothetical protein H7A36_08005 [Chlamydiales bacterium]|nr:hypothetical protein [Chlamydiales bacterium]